MNLRGEGQSTFADPPLREEKANAAARLLAIFPASEASAATCAAESH
jgi:hypothetical protein